MRSNPPTGEASGDGVADPRVDDADWSTACTHYLLRAAMQSARLRELCEQVVTCVGRGRIRPAAHRGAADASEAARGRQYADRVSELTARWFADVAAITGIGKEPGADGLPCGSARSLPEQLPRLARSWFALLDGLGEAGSALAEAHLSSALAAARTAGLDAPFAVDLTAPSGETASALLSIGNGRPDPAVVRCAPTDVRRADGVGPAFVPKLAVAPGRLRLAAEEARDVRLSLPLDPGVYEPGVTYLGAVRVKRTGEAPVDVPTRILASRPAGG
jgi:hypothetical protein